MRSSPQAWFLGLAVLATGAVGIAARSASHRSDASAALPTDTARFGFATRERINDVVLFQATRPFEVRLGNGPIRGELPDAGDYERARGHVLRELGRYTPAFLDRVHLRGVVLTGRLHEGDNDIPSLPNVGGLMLLDVGASDLDLVRALHHEVFHFADLADDGTLKVDARWASLNPPGFAYGAGGRTLRSRWAALPTNLPGFVSAYATSASEEDRAETFAFAVARKTTLDERLDHDAVLAAKVQDIARRVEALDAETAVRLGLRAITR